MPNPFSWNDPVDYRGSVRGRIRAGGNPQFANIPTSGYSYNPGLISSSLNGNTGLDLNFSQAGSYPTANGSTPWQKVFQGANKLMPYVSNLANLFRRPPQPPVPQLMNRVAPRRVDYSDQRVEADRQMMGANQNADASLDPNSAAAVRTANLTQGIRAKNSINSAETNTNAQLGMQNDQLNAGIDAQNTYMTNNYHQQQVERQIAQQTEQGQNLANAADKYIAQGNESAKAQLDLDKLNVYKQLWKNSGVYDRLIKTLQDQKINLPGITNEKMGTGGEIDRYSQFGNMAGTVKGEGWKPVLWNNQYTDYAPGYGAAGKNVLMDGAHPTGSAIIRGYNNGKFDVMVKGDSKESPIDGYQGVDAATAHSYFTNQQSTVNQRVNQLKDEYSKKGKGGWIAHAVNPKHVGYCTPLSNPHCTGRRRALALTFKKHHGFHHKP